MISRNARGLGILLLVAMISVPAAGGSWLLQRSGSYRFTQVLRGTYDAGTRESFGASVTGEQTTTSQPAAFASIRGSGTAILTWVPNPGTTEPPPLTIWLKEHCSAGVSGCGYALDQGGAEFVDDYIYANSLGSGLGSIDRWTRVDSSSGTITRKLSYYAAVQGKGVGGGGGHISVTASGGVGDPIVYNSYNGPKANVTVAPPGHARSPHCPSRPLFRANYGGNHTGPDPVDLATGEHLYPAPTDIGVYNPYGPSVAYTRNFLSVRAKSNYASPGLAIGWVDPYDVRLTPSNPSAWTYLTLTYPNGATERITPILANGVPTGSFTTSLGALYFASGVPSGNVGQWESITITYKSQTTWRFDSVSSGGYMLSRIGDNMDRYISILRDSSQGNRVTSITDDCAPASTLLTFTYSGGYLQQLTDAYGRKIVYTYGTRAGATCLLAVSQIADASLPDVPVLYTYDYTAVGSPATPRLTSISYPSPTGAGQSVHTIHYNSDYQVDSLTDSNGNVTCFIYESPDGTRVQVKDPQGNVQSEWKENFEVTTGMNLATGTTDAMGYNSALYYGDPSNPDRPTRITDKSCLETTITYDQHGNVLASKGPRGTVTTYTYDYSQFPMGRLMGVQEGAKPPTTFTYYEPSGLLHTITGPKPGTTGGSETVTTTFTYDSLGNVLTKTVPGNPDNQTITYNYIQDGAYTQPAKLGQPLTITDNLGHVTHSRYDERGNVLWVEDALGNRTDFSYNIADQLVTRVSPATTP